MTSYLEALHASADRLRSVAGGLAAEQFVESAYPTEWTVADTMSHLGSGATIMGRGLLETLAGSSVPDGFNQSVWDEWNAKTPAEQVADALAADAALIASIDEVTSEQQETFVYAMGPMQLPFDAFLSLRLNEHAVHTWDVEVVVDPGAGIDPTATSVIIDSLSMIAGWTGKAAESPRTIAVRTSDPERRISVTTGPDKVELATAEGDAEPDLELTSEAFIRLVYGRLDPNHTPPERDVDGALDALRATFPGF